MEYENFPKVSIIIPVRNEAAFIISNLESLLSQDYPQEKIEAIIAEGRSDDETREVIEQYIKKIEYSKNKERKKAGPKFSKILMIDNPKKIMPAGANLALRHAKGNLIFLIGGHVILPSDYIKKCVKTILEKNADCVGGRVESIGEGYIGKAVAIAMNSRFGMGNSEFRTAPSNGEPFSTDTVSFCVYRKDVFKRIGYFNERMVRHQDYDLNYRLRKAGGQILLLPSVVIKYYVRSTIADLWRQFWQYGIWKGRFIRKNPASLKFRHLVPPSFVFVLVFGALLSIFFSPLLYVSIFAISAYIGFIFSASIFYLLKGKFKYLPALTIVLLCMHLGWGLGFWKGMLMKRFD
jgi:cellulose synthase/poly-beta-1,6-N-acetylglucosamine synthase-like glycosyltransferase